MRKKETSIIKATSMLILLFSASAFKAQSTQVVPYPFAAEGQKLTITSQNPSWQTLMQASNEVQQIALANLNSGTPCQVVSCVGNVCCKTEAIWCRDHNVYHLITQCVNNKTNELFDVIVQ